MHIFLILGTIFFGTSTFSATVVIGTLESPTLKIHHFLPGNQKLVQALTHPPMTAVNSQWQWVCYLCERVPDFPPKNSRRKKKKKNPFTTEWKIRKGLSWSNNKPVTGTDVAETFNYMMKTLPKEKDNPLRGIKSIHASKKDPRKFTVIFERMRTDFVQLLNFSLLPASVIKQKSVILDVKSLPSYGSYKFYDNNFNSLNLSQSRNSWTIPAEFKKIEIKSFRNEESILSALAKGSVNTVLEDELDFSYAHRLEKINRRNAAVNIRFGIGSWQELLFINLRHPFFADTKVRQAMKLAINRSDIVEHAYQNLAVSHSLPLHMRDPYFPKRHPGVEYDLAQSKRLLDQAGWHYENEKKIRSKLGKELSFSLTTSRNKSRISTYKILKENLKKAGIHLTLEIVDEKRFISESLPKARFSALALVSRQMPPGISLWSSYHSTQIPSEQNNFTGINFGGLTNPRIDKTLESLYRARLFSTKQRLLEEFAALYFTVVPEIPLVQLPTVVIVPSFLRNFIPTASGFFSLLNISAWDLKRQKMTLDPRHKITK